MEPVRRGPRHARRRELRLRSPVRAAEALPGRGGRGRVPGRDPRGRSRRAVLGLPGVQRAPGDPAGREGRGIRRLHLREQPRAGPGGGRSGAHRLRAGRRGTAAHRDLRERAGRRAAHDRGHPHRADGDRHGHQQSQREAPGHPLADRPPAGRRGPARGRGHRGPGRGARRGTGGEGPRAGGGRGGRRNALHHGVHGHRGRLPAAHRARPRGVRGLRRRLWPRLSQRAAHRELPRHVDRLRSGQQRHRVRTALEREQQPGDRGPLPVRPRRGRAVAGE